VKEVGVVGLTNLGNSCFLNSALQCLSNTYELTQYFMEGKHTYELDKLKSLGAIKDLTKAYANFIENVWKSKNMIINPLNIMQAMLKLNKIHENNPKEAISLILDSLHESLKSKSKMSSVYSDSTNDDYWDSYIKSNQSIIADLFYGIYRSSVNCSNCDNSSHTYDPFNILNVSVPSQKNTITAYYVPYGLNNIPLRIAVTVEDQELVANFENRAKEIVGNKDFVVGISSHYIKRLVGKKTTMQKVCRMIEDDQLVLYQINPELIRSKEAMMDDNSGLEDNVIMMPLISETDNLTGNCTTARILFLKKEMTTAKVYRKVFGYMKEYIMKLKDTPSGMRDKSIKELIKKLCPSVNKEWNSKYFTLNIINNNKGVCPFCLKFSCENCEFPYSESITLKSLLSKISCTSNKNLFETSVKRERVFELELRWNRSIKEQVLSLLRKYQDHESVKDSFMKGTGSISLYDCLDQFVKEDTLDEKNKWSCDKCRKDVRAKKSMKIHKAPHILIIALKRSASTLNKLIEFPIKGLDISKYLDPSSRTDSMGDEVKVERYNLFAVSNHYGSIESGHYTTFAQNAKNNEWYCFDDEKINRPDSIISNNAYVLFYRRQDESI